MRWFTLHSLKSKDRDKRLRAIEKLAASRDTKVIPDLMVALKDTGEFDRQLRDIIIQAIGKIGDPAAVPVLIKAYHESVDKQIHHPDRELSAGAVRAALAAIGPSAIEALTRDQSSIALEALGMIGRPAIPALLRLLDNPRCRSDALSALGAMGSEAAEIIPILCRMIEDAPSDKAFPQDTFDALCHIPHRDATHTLLSVFRKGCEHNRIRAAEVLGKTGDSRAIPALVETLLDQTCEMRIRECAAHALRDLRWQPETPDQRAWLYVDCGEFDKAAELGPAAFWPLLVYIHTTRPPFVGRIEDAWDALDKICKATSRDAIPTDVLGAIIELLPTARAAALLGAIGWQPRDQRERALLLAATGRIDDVIRMGRAAADALARTIQPIGRMQFQSTDYRGAVFALAKMGEARAVGSLLDMLGGPFTEEAERLLMVVLKRSRSSVSLEHLERIAHLSPVRLKRRELTGEGLDVRMVVVEEWTVDFPQLRELANLELQELRRRRF